MNNFKIQINKDYNFLNESVTIGNEGKLISINYLNKIRHTLQIEKIKSKYRYFEKIMSHLVDNQMFFDNLLSKKNKNDYMNYLKLEIENTKKYVNKYFLNVFPERLSFFEKIVQLENCSQTIYDHNTVTGRLKIINGTNFLTMKKENRKNLKHQNESRKIYEIDFKSCEPNFYLKSQNINYENEDVYDFLKCKFKIEGARDNLKRGILAIMYGAGTDTVAKISKINTSQIKMIKSYMKIDEFHKKLKLEHEEKGFICNFYGRPLLSSTNLLNHWVQSSTADYCILSFNELLKIPNTEIHGVIHDAVIISTLNNTIENLKSLSEPKSNIKIPVESILLR